MQNKHQKNFLSCWCPNVRGGGGGQAGWDKIPSLPKKIIGRLPLAEIAPFINININIDTIAIYINSNIITIVTFISQILDKAAGILNDHIHQLLIFWQFFVIF